MSGGDTKLADLRQGLAAEPTSVEGLARLLRLIEVNIADRPRSDLLRWLLVRGWEDLEIPYALARQYEPVVLPLDDHGPDWISRTIAGLKGALTLWLGCSASDTEWSPAGQLLDAATSDVAHTAAGAQVARAAIKAGADAIEFANRDGESWIVAHVLDELDFVELQARRETGDLPDEAIEQLVLAVRAARFALLGDR